MKKIFEVPSIERVQFALSDNSMCNGEIELITSGLTTDAGVHTNMTDSQVSQVIE